jgi:hypothetical protein
LGELFGVGPDERVWPVPDARRREATLPNEHTYSLGIYADQLRRQFD